jgi:PAT family beta-lactamase induction signal transducer AmpG
MTSAADPASLRRPTLGDGIRPYIERAPLAALFLGISSGFPFAMIGATLTTRLAQEGIDKKSVTAFTLAFLVYNLKPLWAWIVDGVRLPLIGGWGSACPGPVRGRAGDRRGRQPGAGRSEASLWATAQAAILVGFAGATLDIVIDAYRIELLEPRQLGPGAGMSQYGWRIGSTAAGALALVLAARVGWEAAYLACALFALPAMLTALLMGEPARRKVQIGRRGLGEIGRSIVGPFIEFMQRRGAALVLLFILIHKIGDTLANLTFRLLFDDSGYTNDEIAIYDVGFGFWAYLAGIFIGGVLYSRLGLKRSVLISLVLMGVSNFSFAGLAARGIRTWPWRARSVREPGERDRRGDGRRLFLGAVRSALHGRAICADLGRQQRGRAAVHRHHRGRDDRAVRLCRLLPAHHRAVAAGDRAVLADEPERTGGQLDRLGGQGRRGRRAGRGRLSQSGGVPFSASTLPAR